MATTLFTNAFVMSCSDQIGDLEQADVLVEGTSKRPEGIVMRTGDRKRIAKIRFEDYQRALR